MKVGSVGQRSVQLRRLLTDVWSKHTRSTLQSYASLLFGSKPVVGVLLFGASCFDPTAGLAGLCAALAAASVAQLLGYRKDLVASGFFATSALLCGLALGHGRAFSAPLFGAAILLGMVSAMLTAVLSELFDRMLGLPILVLPFVIATSLLWPALDWYIGKRDSFSAPVVPDLPGQLPDFVTYPLRVCGAIVFQPTTSAGLLVLVALVLCSRLLACVGLWGIAIAATASRWIAPHVDPNWTVSAGYNAMLTCIAIGAVFFVPSLISLLWASSAALLSVWLTLAAQPMAASLKWPILAWPFALVTLTCLRALRLRHPGRPPHPPLLAANPERNLGYLRTLSSRFGLPGPIRIPLPVTGVWTITQGFDGEHTHQGPWRHALDLEIMDERGFPFRSEGTNATDYFCFGAQVHAVAAGTVVFAYGEHEDNPPGVQNLAYPYGNVVVIQHGVGFYSVLAHLQRGSVIVQVGQSVLAGQQIARVGSSGRSPRPHLHLQVQEQPDIGAPTIPFELSHYAVSRASDAEYFPFGLPVLGERLAGGLACQNLEPDLLRVGTEILVVDPKCRERRIRSELSPLGERYLRDLESDQRLYFSNLDGVPAFTTLDDAASPSVLSALALALPRIPPFSGTVVSTERVPAEWGIAWWMNWLSYLSQLCGRGLELTGACRVRRSDTELVSRTEYVLRFLGIKWCEYSASVRIVHGAIVSLDLIRGKRRALDFSAGSIRRLPPNRRRRFVWLPSFDAIAAVAAIPAIAVVATLSMMLTSNTVAAKLVPDPLAESYRYELAGDWVHATQSAAEATKQRPREYFTVLRLAYLELSTQQYRSAAEHYSVAASFAPKAIEPLLGQLQALVLDSEFEPAITVTDKILNLDPNNYVARSRRAWALYRLERYAAAAAEYSTVVEQYPGDIEMRLGRAYALSGARMPVEAALEFREVLKRVPNDKRAKAALGVP